MPASDITDANNTSRCSRRHLEGVAEEAPRKATLLEVQDNPLAAQWGYIKYLLGRKEFRKFSHWRPLVKTAHNIRNHIAHYDAVPFTEYDNLMKYLTSDLMKDKIY